MYFCAVLIKDKLITNNFKFNYYEKVIIRSCYRCFNYRCL